MIKKLFKRKPKKTYIVVPEIGEFEMEYLIEQVTDLKEYDWILKKWTSKPALIDKSGSSSREYTGQEYDNKYFELVEEGWTHDHCEICFATISEGDTNTDFEIEGYNFKNSWICKNCYENFIKPNDLNETLNKFKKIIK